MQSHQGSLNALSVHLHKQRDLLLANWLQAMNRDPELITHSSLSRAALEDSIPAILDNLERRLRAEHALAAQRVELEQRESAAQHGLHRWQQGYDIREIMREWGHLQKVLLKAMEDYADAHPELERKVMRSAREALTTVCLDGMSESIARYVRLKQTDAARRVRDLTDSLDSLQLLENERATLLRQTAHDLRGSVGVIAAASAVLAKPGVEAPERTRFYGMLQRRLQSIGALLTDLVEFGRLEAGQDPLRIEVFDVAARLKEQCDMLRPLAQERNLFLECEGPGNLLVEGDPLKVQRIVQNLALNALRVTERGGLRVRWGTDTREGAQHWILSIEDTGPGFDRRSAGSFAEDLKEATRDVHDLRGDDRDGTELHANQPQPESGGSTPPQSASKTPPQGEGIGLSIVKRLCEVLRACLELDSIAGKGSVFRIAFPLRYPRSAKHARSD